MIEYEGAHAPYVNSLLEARQATFAVVQLVSPDGICDRAVVGNAPANVVDQTAMKAAERYRAARADLARHPDLKSFTIIVEGDTGDMEPGEPVHVGPQRGE